MLSLLLGQDAVLQSSVAQQRNWTLGFLSMDVNIFVDVSWAVYNLDKQYKTLEFIVCHADCTDLGN